MPQRLLVASVLLCSLLGAASAGEPVKPVPERYVIGDWVSADGSQLLDLRADFQAILTLGSAQANATAERHFGTFFVKDRMWTVRLTDLNHRDYTLTLSSLGHNSLNVVRMDGSKMNFQRVGVRLSALDQDRDGVLDADEVKGTRLSRQFLATDVNRDGFISPAEFLVYWKRNPPPIVVDRQ